MKKIYLTIFGIATLLFAFTLNLIHALDDYGIVDNKLHMEILAQSNGARADIFRSHSSEGRKYVGSSGRDTAPYPSPGDKHGNCRCLDVTEGLNGTCNYDCRKSDDPSSICKCK